MSREKKEKDLMIVALDLVIVLMLLLVIEAGGKLVHELRSADDFLSFKQDAKIMSFELQNNDYGALIQGKYINEFRGENDSKLYHALGDYVEAASHYKIYDSKGYNDKAKKQKEKMDNARDTMSELNIFADKVDDFLLISK